MKSINHIFKITRLRFFPSSHIEKHDTFNAFSVEVPQRKNLYQRLFPNQMIWLFLFSIAVKVAIFVVSLHLSKLEGFSRTTDPFFVNWANYWWDVEGLCDFDNDYLERFLPAWRDGAALYDVDYFEGRYLYPPLFYYLIHIFAAWTDYTAPIVMLLCNILTGYFVFHLAKNLGASGRGAKGMMVITLLSPFNLFYSDFIWQNAGVFTTFVVISMYCLSKEKFRWAMIWIGVAISIKQVAAFFLPFMLFGIIYKVYYKPKEQWMDNWTLIQYIKSVPWGTLVYYAAIPSIVFFFASWPYIITIPEQYFGYLLGGNEVNAVWLSSIFDKIVPVKVNGEIIGYFPDLMINENNNPYRVNFRATLPVALAWIGFKLGIPTVYTILFSILFELHALLFLIEGILFLIYWRIIKTKRYFSDKHYYWLLWYAACLGNFASLLFINRGIYKYYFLALTPMWAMYDAFRPLNYKGWKDGGGQTIHDLIKGTDYKQQFFGGGSFYHIVQQLCLQLLLLYFNKWLAPVFLYLPLFLIGIINLYLKGRRTTHEKIIQGINELQYTPKKVRNQGRKKLKEQYYRETDPYMKDIYAEILNWDQLLPELWNV